MVSLSKISAPSFLAKFLTEKHLDENLVKVFMPKAYPTIYKCYLALSEVESLDRSHIVVAEYDKDDESITIKMTKGKYAKEIKKACNGLVIDYGKHAYDTSVKVSDTFAIISFEKIEE